ncbi:hypothetical protein [Chengkuizengella sediminis]|uniref:hypothetical protein n=1 Tax=Chengkuizengella sediminis TaxID=1885917 RepID=UPI00138A5712|nr:hypothetical protein [Chengkuizengella sediminis]NDI35725.1 hypothetical protein [Chengkuizengella sediminis]
MKKILSIMFALILLFTSLNPGYAKAPPPGDGDPDDWFEDPYWKDIPSYSLDDRIQSSDSSCPVGPTIREFRDDILSQGKFNFTKIEMDCYYEDLLKRKLIKPDPYFWKDPVVLSKRITEYNSKSTTNNQFLFSAALGQTISKTVTITNSGSTTVKADFNIGAELFKLLNLSLGGSVTETGSWSITNTKTVTFQGPDSPNSRRDYYNGTGYDTYEFTVDHYYGYETYFKNANDERGYILVKGVAPSYMYVPKQVIYAVDVGPENARSSKMIIQEYR